MTKIVKAFLSFFLLYLHEAGAQNWAPVTCYDPAFGGIIFVDSLHDEIILNYTNVHKVCGIDFKGCLAHNQNGFHTLDFGIDTHNSNPNTGGDRIIGAIPYNGKSLMYGYFASAGSNTLQAEALALWDGNNWSNFPKTAFTYDPQRINTAIIYKILNDNGKLWILGEFQNLGGVTGKNLYTYDGNSFNSISIPASVFYRMTNVIKFKNELIFSGLFYNQPSNSVEMIIRFDGTNWKPMGNGIHGSFDGIWDMKIYKDTLYMAGTMNIANGNPANHIMKWDGTNFYDGGFGNYFGPDAIKQLLVYKNRLYAFGNFLHAANQKAFGIAYYENGKWTVPQDSLDNSINSAVIYHDELYISGGFRSINGDQSFNTLAKLRCPDFDAISGCISSVEDKLQKKSSLKIFPNPVVKYLTIETENLQINKISYTILNSLGQNILSGQLENEKEKIIDVSNLQSGIYFINFYDNTKIMTSKFIKATE